MPDQTANPASITLREATQDDVPLVATLIRGLAEYERLLDQCHADEDGLREHLFGPRRYAEVIIAEDADGPAGFALFFHNYSTFRCKPGIYLEDLFVFPEKRGLGIGRRLLAHLAELAVERDCARLEWSVLDWNAPAIGFYQRLGAVLKDEWTTCQIDGEALLALAGKEHAMTSPRDSEWIIEKREAEAKGGMVAALHPLAAEAGLEILKAGGNAVDAAVATAFAIGVVEPFMSGMGGIAAMVYREAATGKTVVVDGGSRAPSAASPDTFPLTAPGETAGLYGWRGTVGDAQNTGYRSPAVPGTPACLFHCLDRYGSGRLSASEVMAPAIRLAEEGFEVDPYVASTTAFAMRRLRPFAETMRTYFGADGLPLAPASLSKAADRLVQSDLARTLRTLGEQGPGALYEGEIGDRLVADVQANGGLISRRDLAEYRVRELEPLRVEYRGHTLLGIPFGSGNVTTFQMLNILEQFDLAALGPATPEATHLLAEASRRAFLDRLTYLADPDAQAAPFEGVLSKAYAAELAARIDPDRADPDAAPGDPWRFQAGPRPAALAASPDRSADASCTTHLTVVDRDRNVVSLTSTLGELFGCGVVARGTGILLNNGMTWFNPEPGHPNSIEPGKQIMNAFTPTIVLKDGRPLLAVGAPGGRRIISAIMQVLVNSIDFGLGIQAAVSNPRIHSEGPLTQAESRQPSAVLDGLRARGHRLNVHVENWTSFSFARPNGIRIDPATNRLTGGINQYTPSWANGHD